MLSLSTSSLSLWYTSRGLRAPSVPTPSLPSTPAKVSFAPPRPPFLPTGALVRWWGETLRRSSVLRVLPVVAADPEDASARILRGIPFPAEVEMLQKRTHPFYVAPLCEYPLLLAGALGTLLGSTVPYLHGSGFGAAAEGALVVAVAAVVRWMGDLEAMASSPTTYTPIVRTNLLCGVALFIVSEVMVFFGLFWAYLHSALNPAAVLGAVWPPAGLVVLDWYRWPTLSTLLLVFSGFSANTAYYALKSASLRELFGARRTLKMAP